ncbi:hypothetical protein LINPERHAP2_LOCUS14103 [Linum perenne]
MTKLVLFQSLNLLISPFAVLFSNPWVCSRPSESSEGFRLQPNGKKPTGSFQSKEVEVSISLGLASFQSKEVRKPQNSLILLPLRRLLSSTRSSEMS